MLLPEAPPVKLGANGIRRPRTPITGWQSSGLVALIVLVQAALQIMLGKGLGMKEAAEWGTIAGTVAALFSGLAFAGVIIAILLQREELGLQRDELAQTREEIAGQRVELAMQNATLRAQRFDASFFSLLRFNREKADSMRATFGGPQSQPLVGAAAFEHAASDIIRRVVMVHAGDADHDSLRMHAAAAFEAVCLRDRADFGHYLRNLYHLFHFIRESGLDNHGRYARLARSQMSSAELIVLFFNGLHERGAGFNALIDEYALFKNARFPAEMNGLKALYSNRAFA